MLLKIAENCISNTTVQQYIFTRIEEILGLSSSDLTDADREAVGIKHATLFTSDGIKLQDSCFIRGLSSSDIYSQRSAAIGFACLLGATNGNVSALTDWLMTKLGSSSNGVWDMALPALGVLVRATTHRAYLIQIGIINTLTAILKRLGVNGNSQQIYEILFIFWSLSLDLSDEALTQFLKCGSVPILVELIAAAPTKKIIRMSLGTLRNLSSKEDDKVLSEMLSTGVMKLLENLSSSASLSQIADVDMEGDIKALHDTVLKNYRELSTFERWVSEVNSRALR